MKRGCHIYTLAVHSDFKAGHFLIGADWGPENQLNFHRYEVEIRLETPSLNEHGFVADIYLINGLLETTVTYFRDKTLNELPEFEGLNPSLENLCRILSDHFLKDLNSGNIKSITTLIWEDRVAWASFSRSL